MYDEQVSSAIEHILRESVKVKIMCEKIGQLRSNVITREEFWIAYNQYRKSEATQ